MKKLFSLGSILLFVCCIAACALALIYNITKPKIEQNEEKKRIEYRKSVLPDAIRFAAIENKENIFIGYDENNNEEGFAVSVKTKGYGGSIEMIVGTDMNAVIKGLKIVKQTETPGLGANIEKESFLMQFKGITCNNAFLKKESPNGSIDALSGATISSEAVAAGVRDALIEAGELCKSKYADGVYDAKARGHGGIVQVKINIEHGKITNIKAIGSYETRKLWNKVVDDLIPNIIDKQGIEGLDAVSGATRSSRALLEAVGMALEASKGALDGK
ncbi:MAG: RnfABCDGE type electron transport complex subunit G [Elusimicrobiota bacterium]